MLCHWRYVLDNLFGEVKAVSCLGATHIPQRWDEDGKPYKADADDAAYATFQLDGERHRAHQLVVVRRACCRDDLVTFQVDGTHGSAVAGLHDCMVQPRQAHAAAGLEPGHEADAWIFYAGGSRCPTSQAFDNGFKVQWEMFIRHVRRRAVQIHPARGRQRACSWSKLRMQELERAALGRRARAVRRMTDEPHGADPAARAQSGCRAPIARWKRFSCPRRSLFPTGSSAKLNRIAFAAAHVVADPLADNDPWLDCAIDWDATIAYRQHLWGLGLGVAEAMDTAQRGMGLDWPTSLELIRRSLDAARDVPATALVFSGCGTDQLAPATRASVDDVIRAYEEQMAAIEAARRPPDRDGEPRAGPRRARARPTTPGLRPRAARRRASR